MSIEKYAGNDIRIGVQLYDFMVIKNDTCPWRMPPDVQKTLHEVMRSVILLQFWYSRICVGAYNIHVSTFFETSQFNIKLSDILRNCSTACVLYMKTFEAFDIVG